MQKSQKIKKQSKVTNHRQLIMNRLQKYTLGSQSLAVLAGALSQTAICSAAVINLNLGGPIVGDTVIAGGGGSVGDVVQYNLGASSITQGDFIRFYGPALTSYPFVTVGGYGGASVISMQPGSYNVVTFYTVGSTINGSQLFGLTYGYLYLGSNGGGQDVWSANRTGAIGFKTGDNQFGYFNISWDIAAKTLTILGGKYESTASAGIVVTAVPEPSEYAAALGLGAIGLAYYRRRPGNKTRPKA